MKLTQVIQLEKQFDVFLTVYEIESIVFCIINLYMEKL